MEEGGWDTCLGFLCFVMCSLLVWGKGRGLLLVVKLHQHPGMGDGHLMTFRNPGVGNNVPRVLVEWV